MTMEDQFISLETKKSWKIFAHFLILFLLNLPNPGTDDEDQEYDCLGAWGPRFDKLSTMYGQRAIEQIPELDEI